LAHTRNIKKRE